MAFDEYFTILNTSSYIQIFQLANKDTAFGLAEFVALTCTCNTIERLPYVTQTIFSITLASNWQSFSGRLFYLTFSNCSRGPAKEAFQNLTVSNIESLVNTFMVS